MNEAQLKSELMEEFRKKMTSGVFIRLEDHFTHGIPDISIDYGGRHMWLEVKFADPTFTSRSVQEVMMKRLAANGLAFYLIYASEKAFRSPSTMFVWPTNLKTWETEYMTCFDGYNHSAVVALVARILRESR